MKRKEEKVLWNLFCLNGQEPGEGGEEEKEEPGAGPEAVQEEEKRESAEPEETQNDGQPESGPETPEEKTRELEEKLRRTMESTQRRIDELTAQNRRLKERIKDGAGMGAENAEQALAQTQNKLSVLEDALAKAQENIAQAKLDKDEAALVRARGEFKKVFSQIRAAQEELGGLVQRQRQQAVRRLVENAAAFQEGFARAAKKYPKLLDGQGRVSAEDPVAVLAQKKLQENARPSRLLLDFNTGCPVLINPRYDHPDGQYHAVRDALDELEEKDAGDLDRVRYENNLLQRRLERERGRRLDPPATRMPAAPAGTAAALRRRLDEAESKGDVDAFQRIRNEIEMMEFQGREIG